MELHQSDNEGQLSIHPPSSSEDTTLDIAEDCSVINNDNKNSNFEEVRRGGKGSEENVKDGISPLDLTVGDGDVTHVIDDVTHIDEITHDSSAMDIEYSDDTNRNMDIPRTPELAVFDGEILAVNTPPFPVHPDTPPLFPPSPPPPPSPPSSSSSHNDSHTFSHVTAENYPPFFSSFIPTARSFHAEVESIFECTSCGFIREPKRVSFKPNMGQLFICVYTSNVLENVIILNILS